MKMKFKYQFICALIHLYNIKLHSNTPTMINVINMYQVHTMYQVHIIYHCWCITMQFGVVLNYETKSKGNERNETKRNITKRNEIY